MENQITTAASYEYPVGGNRAETVAVLADGRRMTVDCQYGVVLPHGEHAAACDQVNRMGGRCNCGLLAGVDVAALVADARKNGKKGAAPVAVETASEKAARIDGMKRYEAANAAVENAMRE